MKSKEMSIENIIKMSVEAGRISAEKTARDAFKATERRLYALPILRQKLKDDLERLDEIKQYGPRGRSKSITRFIKSGINLTPEEIFDAVVMDMEATIAADEQEIEMLEKALASIENDEYYQTVTGRYIDDLPDDKVAALIPCDTTTVWRNRKRLVQRLAVRLYGSAAVK